MNEQKIKKILKKYDMPFKERKFIENELLNRKIHKRSIRNKIISQGDKVTKLFCLISGSVEISYTLSHQIKPKHFENDEEKETIHKMPKTQHFKLTFILIENQLEFLNEEALMQFIQKQQKPRQLTNQRQQVNRSRQSSNSFKQKKQDHIKCKYTATVISSECEYIDISFDQAKMLLESRLEQIRKRDLERQRLIKEKKRSFKLELETNGRKFMLDKISMPNLHEKIKLNLSPKFNDVHSLANLENKVLTTRYDSRFNSGQKKQDKSIDKILYEPIKKVRSVSNMISSKGATISHDNPFESTFGSSQFHSTQNNLILQRYRQRKELGNAPPHSNQNRFNPLLPKKGVQDKIFKQNLKKIIRKKLKFQRMHGQIIRENAHGFQSDVIQISNEYEYPIQNGELQSQQLLAYQQSDTLVPKLALHSKKPETSRVLPTFNHNTAKHTNSLNKQQFLQKISSENSLRSGRTSLTKNVLKNQFEKESKELNNLKKMRKKMEEHAIFLKLQDLDSYFNKI